CRFTTNSDLLIFGLGTCPMRNIVLVWLDVKTFQIICGNDALFPVVLSSIRYRTVQDDSLSFRVKIGIFKAYDIAEKYASFHCACRSGSMYCCVDGASAG